MFARRFWLKYFQRHRLATARKTLCRAGHFGTSALPKQRTDLDASCGSALRLNSIRLGARADVSMRAIHEDVNHR